MWRLARKLGGKKNGPKKKNDFSMCHRQSDPALQIGEDSGVVHVNMEDVKGLRRRGRTRLNRTNKETNLQNHHFQGELLRRIAKELARGNARRAVPSWSIPREISLIGASLTVFPTSTATPVETDADLSNRLLQTTSLRELLAIMRDTRERQFAKSEEPTPSIGYWLPDPAAAHETQGPALRIAGSHKRERCRSCHVATVLTSASR